ncbi:MAG: bifunctional UDP-3-O-[3-hydroxymyristoyl] N-acetylglucosamine deacetylase/3-hydroxyacyl-ACP dehydratase [Flavobacteriales bacterium]|nr:bifunctional UDP-3-O-[3-hydroxymyristoyl] N-acetylglucosamine deacetylase/3-hydroxyacyl-ACP dehydratase [Flavobacteriales bacterium]
MEQQHSIKNKVSISGIGLHTGNEVTLTFNPACVNHGIRFQRIDLPGKPIIEADARYVTETDRGTTLNKKGAKLQTIEHILAACAGLKIDNLLIELNGEEPPILDGSSIEFINCLKKAKIQAQNAVRKYFVIEKEINYEDPETGIRIQALPADEFSVSVSIDYNSKVLGKQTAELKSIDEFENEFADARTFCFLHELELLLDHGLIKGGDLSNAIVYVEKVVAEKELERLATLFKKERIGVCKDGHLNNLDLRYSNEAARHKLLDVIGDLMLVGLPIKGKIIAHKPGHGPNTTFAKIMKEVIKKQKNQPPAYDPNATPVMDIHQIMDTLPHRPPFLLVDKVLELSDCKVVGLKNVTMNEPFFKGHFPGKPVMPGVLQIEAMAQVGGILVLNTVPDPENYLTYFMKIDKVKFKNKVLPGDTLIFDLELISPIRRGICHMSGRAFVGDKIVMEGEMIAQIAKKH